MTLIVDTGGLLSVLDGDQDDHELFLEAVQSARGPLLVSPLVLAELDHLILDCYGRQAELAAIEEVEAAYQVEQIGDGDLVRAQSSASAAISASESGLWLARATPMPPS